MSSTQAIQLCSAADKGSFLVPAMGFQTKSQCASEFEKFSASVSRASDLADRHQMEPAFDGETFYQPIYRQGFSYLPRIGCGNWAVQSFRGLRPELKVGVPTWIRLACKDGARPEGSYNVALLVEGRRQYSRWSHRTRKHPKWWYRLADGNFDCCTIWGRSNSPTLDNGFVVDGSTRFFAARSARGAIYTRRTGFDNNGTPNGYTTGLVLVEFNILDRHPTKDNMLKVQVVASRTAYSHKEGSIVDPFVDDLDAGWQALAARARSTFDQLCKPIPDDIDEWRKSFIEQKEKWRAQLRAFNSAATFADGISTMPWDQALQLVQEPWQLKVVVGKHCHHQFDESPHRSDTNGSRVWRMLSQFPCDAVRREELEMMVHEFVEPDDELWSYSGD